MPKRDTKELLELEIESIAFQGSAIARKDGIVYFAKGGLPGEKVIASISKKKKNYFEAQVEKILETSPHRINAKCKYFGICGGCSWQDLDYTEQLRWKKTHVLDALTRIGKVSSAIIEDTLPSKMIYNYRNKMEFSFSNSRWLTNDEMNLDEAGLHKNFALGLHIPGRYDKVLDIEECHISPPVFINILNEFKKKALELGVQGYSQITYTGFLRNLILRNSVYSNELLVNLVTHDPKEEIDFKMLKWFENESLKIYPEISTLVHTINNTVTPVSYGSYRVVSGKEFITENINDLNFRISPDSFFQTNSHQLGRFVNSIIGMTEINKSDIIWDLYCGSGLLSLSLSKYAKQVYGVELIENSILNARQNAELNNITNVAFFTTDLHNKNNSELLSTIPKADVIVLDPPRAGMHTNLLDYLLTLDVKNIIYVSCNPSTQARDCELLSKKFIVKKVQPVDMFPQTFHVESIALLEYKL